VRGILVENMAKVTKEMCAKTADELRRAANLFESIALEPDPEKRLDLLLETDKVIDSALQSMHEREE
jgi:hypothetical protein